MNRRAAIEALARDATDPDWLAIIIGIPLDAPVHFESGRVVSRTERAALLAYLDEVWAGLKPDARICLERFGEGLEVPGPLRRAPLGRAVLKRAKDTGR